MIYSIHDTPDFATLPRMRQPIFAQPIIDGAGSPRVILPIARRAPQTPDGTAPVYGPTGTPPPLLGRPPMDGVHPITVRPGGQDGDSEVIVPITGTSPVYDTGPVGTPTLPGVGGVNPTPPSTPSANIPSAPSSAPDGNANLVQSLAALLAGDGQGAQQYDAATNPTAQALDALTPTATPTSSTGNAAAIVVVMTIAAAVALWFYFKHKGALHGK